jgi:SAM-dependent methyltransferase
MFKTPKESYEHSLKTLNGLYEYDDFMLGITTMIDLGCGEGLDLEWWATRTTREDSPRPLNIKCTGVDIIEPSRVVRKYPNITYQKIDFESKISRPIVKQTYDLLWCHDAFQFAINPIHTLSEWWHIASPDAMLVIIVPQTTNIFRRKLNFTLQNKCYYHHTIVSLIQMLALTGWDCRDGFFQKSLRDDWISCAVYKSEHKPMNPKETTWYDLQEKKLLPISAEQSVLRNGYLKQEDLVLPWLDHSLTVFNEE